MDSFLSMLGDFVYLTIIGVTVSFSVNALSKLGAKIADKIKAKRRPPHKE